MSTDRICENCAYWDTSRFSNIDSEGTGTCRRRAPAAVDDRTGLAMFPITEDADWCGDFEAEPPQEAGQ